MNKSRVLFFDLLQVATETRNRLSRKPLPDEWYAVKDLADKQGLLGFLLNGLERLPDEQRPPKIEMLQWIGETLQGYDYRFGQYKQAISELASFYNSQGFKMMVLKGYACSLDWPKPEHRPCGDIDIWLFGKQREADELLTKEKGVQIDYGHNIHSIFNWRDFAVENHYEFFYQKRYLSLAKLEQTLEEMAEESYFIEIQGAKVYMPSANFHALFLIIHALNHFASIGINLRQVLDWAFFVKKHTTEIDWAWLNKVVEEYHMNVFISCLNAICVEDLGFDASIFHGVQFNPALKDRVLREIINPKYGNNLPKYLIPRLFFKYKRWRESEWKRELCYNESRWSSFSNGLWRHLMKPETI